MTFISKVKKNEGLQDKPNVKSFNEETIRELSKYTPKYLIVGTLTPFDGRDMPNKAPRSGFFYCSEKNKLYHLVDLAFGNNELENAKENLRNNKGSKDDIKKILRDREIAFLDVVDEACVDNQSAKDNDISSFSLDEDSFKEINYSALQKIIVNSLNAYAALEEIVKSVPNFAWQKVVLIPQSIRGYYVENPKKHFKPTYRTQLEFEDAWRTAF